MIKDKKWFPVLYMFLITAFVSSIVIGFTQWTGDRVEANRMLAFEKAVLAVLPGLYDEKEKVPGMRLHERFIEKVKPPDGYSAGAYTLADSGNIIAYALPISGRGFWAPIRAVIGIEADKKTISGVAIYEQNETPGLGAEIVRPEFRNQFKGKGIVMGEKPLRIKRPGTPLDQNSVHAITGATQTSVRLENMMNEALMAWRTQLDNDGNGDSSTKP